MSNTLNQLQYQYYEKGVDGGVEAPSLTPQSLAATASISASGSETTFSDWSADVAEGDSYVPTVDIGGDTYLDVRHLSYLRVRGEADTSTDADFNVYERRTASDTDKNSVSALTISGNSIGGVYEQSVEGISYVRVTANEDSTVYAGGSA